MTTWAEKIAAAMGLPQSSDRATAPTESQTMTAVQDLSDERSRNGSGNSKRRYTTREPKPDVRDELKSNQLSSHTRHISIDDGLKVAVPDVGGDTRPEQRSSRRRHASIEAGPRISASDAKHEHDPRKEPQASSTPELEEVLRKYNKVEGRYRNLKGECRELQRMNEHQEDRISQLKRTRDHYEEWMRHIVKTFYHDTGKPLLSDGDALSIAAIIEPLLQDALESNSLRLQVRSLQQQLLSSVEKIQSIPDEQFSQDFRILASLIKSLSRSVQLSGEVDIIRIDSLASSLLVNNVPQGYWTTRPRKRCMIEAFIWSALLDYVFRSPFRFLGPRYIVLQELFTSMFGQGHDHQWPIPTELAERWRYTTLEQYVANVGSEAFTRGFTKQADPDLEGSILQVRMDVGTYIGMTLCNLSPTIDGLQISTIVDKAFALALQMSLQRCRIQVVYPAIGEPFAIGETPHLASIPESEEVEEGSVVFIVNPGLAKWGDTHGKNLAHRLDLVASKVFIEANAEDIKKNKVEERNNAMVGENSEMLAREEPSFI